ncbi:MAG TPA: hypothetical protein VH087_14540, partial [Thermoanaerobaculia bacterium]|nr:hypothetical protein [Thermoanaerobaculia bacterium]
MNARPSPGASRHPLPVGEGRFLGARVVGDRTEFRVWAPYRDRVELHIVAPLEQRIAMERNADGYHVGIVECGEGTRYFFNVEGTDRPDPASRLQPEGV